MKRVVNIVEDERDINNLVAQYLRKDGYEVHSYYTYEEASAHVGDDDVHLWILDIMLDDKSGFDLLESIRLQAPDIPVIFMSARDKEFDRIIGLEKGCDDYITKPFSPKEVVLRVNNIMKRAYKDNSTRISVDGYELDEVQRKIYTDNVEIELTTKEFDLLMMFIKNKGIAFHGTRFWKMCGTRTTLARTGSWTTRCVVCAKSCQTSISIRFTGMDTGWDRLCQVRLENTLRSCR